MSFFSAYSAGDSVEQALSGHVSNDGLVPNRMPSTMGMFLADVLECSISICTWSSLKFVSFIGSGTSMDVWQGTLDAKPVAIKRLRVGDVPQGLSSVDVSTQNFVIQLKAAAFELRCMSLPALQRCPNVVDLLAVSWIEEGPEWQRLLRPALVVELAVTETPNLEHLMSKLDSRNLNVKRELLDDILEGLQAIHDSGIIHGDVKPDNILIFHDSSRVSGYIVKLSDFGFAQLDPDGELASGGTPYWNAPECIPDCPAELAQFKTARTRDVYSFGLLATYVICGVKPFFSDAAEDWPGKRSKVDNYKLDDAVSQHVQSFVFNSIRITPAMKTKLDLDNMSVLGETIQEMNKKLVDGDHTFEVYDHNSNTWKEADGWLPVGYMYFLSFTTIRNPVERRCITELRYFFGFSRREDYSKVYRFPSNTPLLGLKALSPRLGGDHGSSPHERVPKSMRPDLFRHIKLEAEHEQCDGGLKAFVSYWYHTGFGVTKNDAEGDDWALRAALAPCQSPATKFKLMVDVLRRNDSDCNALDEATERDMIAKCLSYTDVLYRSSDSENDVLPAETKSEFAEIINKQGLISTSTLRREFQHSINFPYLAHPTLTPQPDHDALVQQLESDETTDLSNSGILAGNSVAELFALSDLAISSRSFTAVQKLIVFQPVILQERDATGFNILQRAVATADFAAAAFLYRLGASVASLFEPRFIRNICALGVEYQVAYLEQAAFRIAELDIDVRYDLQAAIEDSSPLEDTESSSLASSTVPAIHGTVLANNARNLATLLAIKFDRPLNLEARTVNGLTPLWTAIVLHNTICAALLIHAKADAFVSVEGFGHTVQPLHYLCATGNEEFQLVKHLDRIRMDIENAVPLETSFGRLNNTQMDEVRNELCSILLHLGRVDVNAPDSEGMTPLMWCCKRGFLGTAKHLVREATAITAASLNIEQRGLSNAVDFAHVDNRGRSALDHAILADNDDVAGWLQAVVHSGSP